MANLGVSLPGLDMSNPLMLASGIQGGNAAALHRVAATACGGLVSKSIGPEPREMYPGPVCVEAADGVVLNAMGLPNPGADAFAELLQAETFSKPLLVSIGYSACHWCHVMEHESFENPDIAAEMNRLFINIKVDREERPDVDQIYMDTVVGMMGHGGWPLTVFCPPDGRPFYGGTYYPPERRQQTSFPPRGRPLTGPRVRAILPGRSAAGLQ